MRTVSDERAMLRATVAALVAKHAPSAMVRAAITTPRGYDEQLWRLLCDQVGAAALVVPEEYGGVGGALGDAAVVLEELAKNLVPTPLLGTTLAELALLMSADPDPDALARLVQGTSIGAVVLDPEYVLNGDVADVVVAAPEGGLSRWLSYDVQPLRTMDPTRRLARLTPRDTATISLDDAPAAAAKIGQAAAILLAAEQIGAATRCLELTVNYTKQRVQFGRPIGSFQALKHRMADLYAAVQVARAVVNDAIAEPSASSAALARLAASETLNQVAAEGIQLHGGIAITWEHDMHLYFKRAHGSSQLLGTAQECLRQLEAEVL